MLSGTISLALFGTLEKLVGSPTPAAIRFCQAIQSMPDNSESNIPQVPGSIFCSATLRSRLCVHLKHPLKSGVVMLAAAAFFAPHAFQSLANYQGHH